MSQIGIKDVAREANVSIGTVDRVIHNRGRVAKTTHDRVLRVCREMNYRPNILAQRLAADRPVVLATLIPESTEDNAYWEMPLEGIKQAAQEISSYKVEVVFFFFRLTDPETFRKASLDCLLRKPDGILLAPSFKREAYEFVKKCEANRIPYVYIDSFLENTVPVSSFYHDPYDSGYLAGRLLSFHLKKRSHILVINFSVELENNIHLKKREEGLRRFFLDLQFDGKITSLEIRPEEEYDLTSRIEAFVHHKTRGVFITSSAHKVAHSMEKVGKANMMIVGYDLTPDNILYLRKGLIDVLLYQKPVTQGYKAIMALFDALVRDKIVEQQSVIPVAVVVKENYLNIENL